MIIKTFPDLTAFADRRQRLSKEAGNSLFVLFSGVEGHLDRFRPASSFVYLTGFEEPDACAVIRTGPDSQFTLFVRERNPDVELWDGERFGVERAKSEFLADQSFSIADLAKELPELMRGADSIYFDLGANDEFDQIVLAGRKKAQQLDRRAGGALAAIKDPNIVLGPMRRVKDKVEQNLMRESCRLSAEAHNHVMKQVAPGKNERQVHGDLLYSFYNQEALKEGYSSIIASGVNATVLHYRANNRGMQDGDFLLIDAGAEKSYYTADITRTYPVNGRFTEPQKKVYQAVLDVQKKLIQCVQPGFSLPELQEKCCLLITEKLIELGLLKGQVQNLVDEKAYSKYYPHGVGHYLGMDVHDIGLARANGKPVPFEEGVVITVEPGIYVPKDDESAPVELRGLGVRIEDDILVTSSGCENLTELAKKEISEIESWMRA